MGQSLKDLLLAIEGAIILSPAIKDTLDSMFDARVPDAWKKVSMKFWTLGYLNYQDTSKHVYLPFNVSGHTHHHELKEQYYLKVHQCVWRLITWSGGLPSPGPPFPGWSYQKMQT